jgi:surface antigen
MLTNFGIFTRRCSVDLNVLSKYQWNKRRIITAGLVIFIALGFLSFVVVKAVASARSNSKSQSSISSTQKFDINLQNSGAVKDETIGISVKGDSWDVTPYNLNYSNQQELLDTERRRAEQSAAAAQRASAVITNNVVQSYQAVAASGSPQGAPFAAGTPLAPDNRYAGGYCTWYAYNRRYALGRPVPNMLGNGGSWHYTAPGHGLGVGHEPQVGAVFEQAGHVAVVEAIGENNTVYVSEMNWVGLWRYSERWVANASGYWYIY